MYYIQMLSNFMPYVEDLQVAGNVSLFSKQKCLHLISNFLMIIFFKFFASTIHNYNFFYFLFY